MDLGWACGLWVLIENIRVSELCGRSALKRWGIEWLKGVRHMGLLTWLVCIG